jgi:hypothetical protein
VEPIRLPRISLQTTQDTRRRLLNGFQGVGALAPTFWSPKNWALAPEGTLHDSWRTSAISLGFSAQRIGTPETPVLASDGRGAYPTFEVLCLPHYVSDVFAFLFSEPPFDSGCWQVCWEEPVCCPKAGAAGCTTQKAQTPRAEAVSCSLSAFYFPISASRYFHSPNAARSRRTTRSCPSTTIVSKSGGATACPTIATRVALISNPAFTLASSATLRDAWSHAS